MPRADAIDRLKSQLLVSGLQQKNAALFQVINQLIGILRDTTAEIEELTGGSGGGSVTTGQTILTLENEQSTLPNSRRLVPGAGITMMTNGEQTVIGASPNPLGIEELREEFLMLQQGVQNSPAGPNAVSTPYVMIDDRGEDDVIEYPGLFTLQNANSIPEAAITDGSILARIAANETISGQWMFTNPVLSMEANGFQQIFRDPSAPVDEKYWRFVMAGGDFYFQALNDAFSVAQSVLLFGRNGVDINTFRIHTGAAVARTLWDSNGVMDHRFGLMLSSQLSVSLTADQTAWSPTSFGNNIYYIVAGTAAWTIRGITALSAGHMLIINNNGGFNIVLSREDGAASAANRISMDSAIAGLTLGPGATAILTYDGLRSRWVVISGF